MLFGMKFLAVSSNKAMRGQVFFAGCYNGSLCTSRPLSPSSSDKPALHELVDAYLKVHKRQQSLQKLSCSIVNDYRY